MYFQLHIIFTNRNESLEHFLEDKCGRCVRLIILLPSYAIAMKFGNLNFPEPSGPLQACNGTSLPLSHSLRHVSANNCGLQRIVLQLDKTVELK